MHTLKCYGRLQRMLCDLHGRLFEGFVKGGIAMVFVNLAIEHFISFSYHTNSGQCVLINACEHIGKLMKLPKIPTTPQCELTIRVFNKMRLSPVAMQNSISMCLASGPTH